MEDKVHKILIVGSGPAGLTAALYAARADLEPVVIHGGQPGGQLTITTDVENYPGFPDGIMGPELIAVMTRQAERFGTRFFDGRITGVDLANRPFTVTMENGNQTLRCHILIVATGASARLLGIESESTLMGYGVSACATCDGFFFKDKEILVVGGGDTAMEEATFLTKFASRVRVVHRRDELRASKIMQERAKANPKIDFIWDSVVEECLGVEDKKLRGARLRNVKTDETTEVACDGLFIAIGHNPNTDFLNGRVETDKAGFILTDAKSTRTSVEGIFACGDVMDPHYRQAITAAGTGCQAAMDAEKALQSMGLES